jgi:hypothetical protein
LLIDIFTNGPGPMKNFQADCFPCPRHETGRDLFLHRTQPCHMGSVHPAAVALHDSEHKTIEGLTLICQPETDE